MRSPLDSWSRPTSLSLIAKCRISNPPMAEVSNNEENRPLKPLWFEIHHSLFDIRHFLEIRPIWFRLRRVGVIR